MPIYEYVCSACDHRADILHGIDAPGPKFCPSCGREGTMRKQFAPPAIHYKGSGWAKKDRGSSSSTRAASSSRSSGDGSGDGSGSKAGASDGGTGGTSGSSGSSDSAGSSGSARSSESSGGTSSSEG